MAGKGGNKAKAERGVCILCGREMPGAAARQDLVIMGARKIRSLLRMPPSHTVACADCLPLCAKKRQAFEKSMKNWRIAAAAFVLFMLSGALYYGRLGFWLAAPALVGAAIILLVPYGDYFPAFEAAKK